jgi:hypothetical protein
MAADFVEKSCSLKNLSIQPSFDGLIIVLISKYKAILLFLSKFVQAKK